MKKLIIIVIVLSVIAGTVLAGALKPENTFAQENLEALADGELTPQLLLELCEKQCVLDMDKTCSIDLVGYSFPITCVNHINWP